jgi:hypothetical protein
VIEGHLLECEVPGRDRRTSQHVTPEQGAFHRRGLVGPVEVGQENDVLQRG